MARIIPFGHRYNRKKGLVPVTSYQCEFTFPDGFVIVIDTREQDGLFRDKPPKGLMMIRDTLKYGDYSIRGLENLISVERKNLDDLWSSVTVEKERFSRELVMLSTFQRKYILVEGLESEALRPDLGGRKIHPNVVRQALASIEAKLAIPVHFSPCRFDAERWMLDMFVKFYKHWMEVGRPDAERSEK